jgi:large conductance mechanosensitive channel
MLREFKEFLTEKNALALAIGVIIGGATTKLVSGVVGDLLMPIIAIVIPQGDWREWQWVLSEHTDKAGKLSVNAIKYGDFIGTVIDFVVISFVVFLITKMILPKPAPAVPTKTCPECLETVPEAARKCRACTSALAA